MSRTSRAFLITGILALLAAASTHLLVLLGFGWAWTATIHLHLAGWVTGIILAVSYHTIPTFSARDFPSHRFLALHWTTFTLGIVFGSAGLLSGWAAVYRLGLLLQLSAALLFVLNIVLLFVRGTTRGARLPSPAFPDQRAIDRLGTQATKMASMCLPLALVLLMLVEVDWVSARWLLAAEHLMTLGWVMLMIVGVAIHVLPRFSGQGLRGYGWVRAQLACHILAISLMVPALGWGWNALFAIGALLMLLALTLFAWSVWPTLVVTVARPRPGFREQPR